MFKFFKNKEKRKMELAKAREERFQAVMGRLQIQDVAIEKQKKELVDKVKAAQRNGLPSQVSTGRKLLANCLAMEKRVKGMIMNLEYSVQSRELSSLTKDFLVCLKEIGEDIRKEVALTDTKAEKEYEKAMYALEKQTEILDSALETNNIAMTERASEEVYSKEIEEEMDMLLGKKSRTFLNDTHFELDEI